MSKLHLDVSKYPSINESLEAMIGSNSGSANSTAVIQSFDFNKYANSLDNLEQLFSELIARDMLEAFVEGEEQDIEAIASESEISSLANELLTDFFENADWVAR